MLAIPTIRPALPQEAPVIAELSRDNIEHGLGWSWTTTRVLHAIRDPSTNVAVALKHLGARLVAWLEQSARTAGIHHIQLEARADNLSAIAFYQRLGFAQSGSISGYYEGMVDAVQFEKRFP